MILVAEGFEHFDTRLADSFPAGLIHAVLDFKVCFLTTEKAIKAVSFIYFGFSIFLFYAILNVTLR